MAKDENVRYALENVNLSTGERVRYMETSQSFVADLLSAKANEYFQKSGRPFKSEIIEL